MSVVKCDIGVAAGLQRVSAKGPKFMSHSLYYASPRSEYFQYRTAELEATLESPKLDDVARAAIETEIARRAAKKAAKAAARRATR